jgi:transcriptional regulator with XRE-family HTH domain
VAGGHLGAAGSGAGGIVSGGGDSPGDRIARARRRRGLSQAVLAGLAGRSESWLSQVERGKRGVDSHAVLLRLAEVLRLDVKELTGPAGEGEEGPRLYEPAAAIEQAMMCYEAVGASMGDHPAGASGSAGHLEAKARTAYRGYQATRYDDTGRMLPALIRDVEAASRVAGLDNPAMCAVRVLVYDTTAALLNRVGNAVLSWAAADRAMLAAEQSGQPVLIAMTAWRMSYVVTSRRHPQQALELAMTAASALESAAVTAGQDMLSVYGALHLAAATAAAAVFDRSMTSRLLGKAREIAGRVGQGNHMGTAFGHVNVAVHSIATALQLGDPRAAIETGEALDLAGLPAGLTGRRTQVSLDLARAYAMRKQDAAAVNLLLAAEKVSPQLVRYDSRTREVLTTLLRREHQPSTPELRPLAHRAGVI